MGISNSKNIISYFSSTTFFKLIEKSYLIGLPLLVYEITKSPFSMGTMFLIQTLPLIFVSPIIGVIVDRFSQKPLLIFSSLLQGVLILILALLYSLDYKEISTYYFIGLLISASGSCFSIANSTVIPQLFSKDKLVKINSYFQFIDTGSTFIGSMLAGIIIAKFGLSNLFIFLSIFYMPIILALLFLSFNKNKPMNKQSTIIAFKEGILYLWNHTILRTLTILMFVVNIANGSLISMLVYFSRDIINISALKVSWIYAGSAVIQILAILIFNFFSRKIKILKIMFLMLVISSIGIMGVSLSNNWLVLMIFVSIQSAPVIIFNVLNRTYRQKFIPIEILGRVNGIMVMIALVSLPLSGFFTGIISEHINIRFIFATLGLFSLVITLYYINKLKNENQLLTDN